MTGTGTGSDETGDLERAVQEARRHIHEELAALPAWTADVVRDELQRLERAVEARTREQVAREASRLRVRSDASRQVHEAVATRFGLLLPACGLQYGRTGPPAPDGADVTCPFCNGDEQPMKEQPVAASLQYAWCFSHGRLHQFHPTEPPWCTATWVYLNGAIVEEATADKQARYGNAQFIHDLPGVEAQVAVMELSKQDRPEETT